VIQVQKLILIKLLKPEQCRVQILIQDRLLLSLQMWSLLTYYETFSMVSTYLGWLFERDQFPRDLLILVQLEAASIPDQEDRGIGTRSIRNLSEVAIGFSQTDISVE